MGDVNSLGQIVFKKKMVSYDFVILKRFLFYVLIIIIILKLIKNYNVVKYESSRLDPQRKHTHIIFILCVYVLISLEILSMFVHSEFINSECK